MNGMFHNMECDSVKKFKLSDQYSETKLETANKTRYGHTFPNYFMSYFSDIP